MIKTRDAAAKEKFRAERVKPVRSVQRVASTPAALAGGDGPPLLPPVVVAAAAPDGYPKRIILHMPADLTRWLDEEWHRRKLPSRAETIRALLSEARGK